VERMFNEGTLTEDEHKEWQIFLARPAEQFAMTFNVLMIMARKH
jgi:hypothetical protein